MAAVYLWINAVLYALLALWCTVLPTRTSQAIGFIELSSSGRSEYAVIYGGMQFGFAFLFAWAALSGNHRFGLIFSLAIYVPILLFRIVSVLRFWPVSATTLATGALEVLLTAAAIALWLRLDALD
ncbi:DUF4345 domain-containing protein [Dokdonella immobilis]|uniref:DUF4345 domain-containing protein n=1 Tax=Dokdonella immobilis TaxID=578942 RepID=A0A1I4WHF8_9GAMM|nr:DUF4345 domain-containing protein [Dokdonella immobilis]SFN13264.1 hypothetical protein SAMN05216289_10536 [Dokdonella immobilis]